MIQKAKASKRQRAAAEPLAVELSLTVRFGDEPDESVTVMKDRAIPMVNSVFHYRDRILRQMSMLIFRAGMTQPKVVRELFPLLRSAGTSRRGKRAEGQDSKP